jgi:hypothetical protein
MAPTFQIWQPTTFLIWQYILDLKQSRLTLAIVSALHGNIPEMSLQKFSSNVIEKCLTSGDPEASAAEIYPRYTPEIHTGDTHPRYTRDTPPRYNRRYVGYSSGDFLMNQ